MLRETLKQEIDKLSDSQLRKIADFIDLVKIQAQQLVQVVPFWQRATPVERAADFRKWVSLRSCNSSSEPINWLKINRRIGISVI